MTTVANPRTPALEPAAEPASVLHVRVVTGSGGGPEKTILLSPRFLERLGYRAAAAYLHPPADPGFRAIRRRAAEQDAPLIACPDFGPLDATLLPRLWRHCRRLGVSIWHAHDYKSNLLGLMLRPLHPMTLVTTIHGWVVHTRRTPLYYRVDRWCLPRYDHVFAVSQDLCEAAADAGVQRDRLTHLPNAIDLDAYRRRTRPADAALRRELGTPPGRLVLGGVGRLAEEKCFDTLIRATAELTRRGRDVELWIVGDGDQRARLESLVDQLGLTHRVRLLGYRADPRPCYEAMDVFVLASRREGLPNVLLEAAAMGTAIVSTRVAGVPGMLTDGRDALLCDVDDLDGLTAALRHAVDDAGLRDRLADQARELVETRYGFAERMQRVAGCYDALRRLRRPAA